MKIVECVPNFSEGRNRGVIDAITAAICEAEGVRLLDVDPGADTNRTVVTFIGSPQAVAEGAFRGIKKASELIDMSRHQGAHARMGATDVCPFIPVSDVTMEECAAISREVGERVARELKIPVYLYEYSATRPQRQNLSEIREGEYEALPRKLNDPAFAPDFGEPVFNPRSGATVMGAREFLIAYNINLNTADTKKAKEIASIIREKGYFEKDASGKFVRDGAGEKVRRPGMFNHCKATGWYIEEYARAQITMNLTSYRQTPPHLVFDACCRLAEERGLRVTGSELVGLIPKDAMLMAGRHYLQKQGRCQGAPEPELIRTAIQSMGLSDITPFDPAKKIIEYMVEDNPRALAGRTITAFAHELSSDSPAPGGGSVAALCGALSAALSAMVANLTFGKKDYAMHDPDMDRLSVEAQALKEQFLESIDRDTEAFNRVIAAMKMKGKSPEEKAAKEAAVEAASKEATLVPLSVLEMIPPAMAMAEEAAGKGNRNSISDAGVAALCAWAAAKGAWYNVMINLKGIKDEAFKGQIAIKAGDLLNTASEGEKKVSGIVSSALS
jgi:glutamate formiminotransferase/formiminotetrahydrofolate cyclodeaminase